MIKRPSAAEDRLRAQRHGDPPPSSAPARPDRRSRPSILPTQPGSSCKPASLIAHCAPSGHRIRRSSSLEEVGTDQFIGWCNSALAVVIRDEIAKRGDFSLFKSQPQTSVWHTSFAAAVVVHATKSLIESKAVAGQATFRAAFKGHERNGEGYQEVAQWVAKQCRELKLCDRSAAPG